MRREKKALFREWMHARPWHGTRRPGTKRRRDHKRRGLSHSLFTRPPDWSFLRDEPAGVGGSRSPNSSAAEAPAVWGRPLHVSQERRGFSGSRFTARGSSFSFYHFFFFSASGCVRVNGSPRNANTAKRLFRRVLTVPRSLSATSYGPSV